MILVTSHQQPAARIHKEIVLLGVETKEACNNQFLHSVMPLFSKEARFSRRDYAF